MSRGYAKKKFKRTFNCERCGIEDSRKVPWKKYCNNCSIIIHKEYIKEYYKKRRVKQKLLEGKK